MNKAGCGYRVYLIAGLMAGIFFLHLRADVKASETAFSKNNFSVKCNGLVLEYGVHGVFVLPGQNITLDLSRRDFKHGDSCRLHTRRGKLKRCSASRWSWEAPLKTGVYPLKIYCQPLGEEILLNFFVMIPYKKMRGSSINGYLIGHYPQGRNKRTSIYTPPNGFIEVTEDNKDTRVSPHFTLGQFLCKQAGGYPKYVVLDEQLLIKLEKLLEKVNARGYACNTFSILSGYRTPYYNRTIRNVRYSSHVWGRAADIFIDEDHDGMMDDLNQDGEVDYRDAQIIHSIIELMDNKRDSGYAIGGLGLYPGTASHGPFVHLDVRGLRARWGMQPKAVFAEKKKAKGKDKL